MSDQLRMEPPPRTDDIPIWTRNGLWHRIKPADYMAKLAVLEANLPYVTREIPHELFGSTFAGGTWTLPDEVATNNVTLNFYVPATWDGTTDITVTTIWFCDNTGLVDLETEIIYRVETDETATTTVQAFTNSNLTWSAANVTKTLTTTITPAAGRHYRVRFRRNTGDANTGTVFFQSARATTKVR